MIPILLGCGIGEWPLSARSVNSWATRPQIVSSMANVVSVVKPVIWLGRVRPAGEGVLGGLFLFWPVLPPWSFMRSTLCAMGFGPSFIVVEDVVVEKEVADEDSVEDDEDAVVEDEGGEGGVRRDNVS